MRKLLALALALLLTLSAAPAAASCYGGPCSDVLPPPEPTTIYLPSLQGEAPPALVNQADLR